MNKIIWDSLLVDPKTSLSELCTESYIGDMNELVAGLNDAVLRSSELSAFKNQLTKENAVNSSIVMESYGAACAVLGTAKRQSGQLTAEQKYSLALEAVEGAQATVMDKIKEFIKKIIAFAVEMFNRIKNYIAHILSTEERNKSSLNETQRLLDLAKKQSNGPSVATEGYSTGSIPIQIPSFLHLEYSKIIAETEKLEQLAASYIKDTVALLTLQFRHCKFVIEAYNKLMNSPDANLQVFDETCRHVVEEGERRAKHFATELKVFNCIHILEEIKDNQYAGVLKYRASIKPPEKDDMAMGRVTITTNLMKAQDLQDRLVALNEEIVKYATQIRTFFAANSKVFLDVLNKLNDSAVKSPTGTFDAHSEYVTQVHSFLVRGNLIQVVLGLNVLNTVWKSVHDLNTRVVREFINSR